MACIAKRRNWYVIDLYDNQESARKLENSVFKSTGSKMVANTKKEVMV